MHEYNFPNLRRGGEDIEISDSSIPGVYTVVDRSGEPAYMGAARIRELGFGAFLDRFEGKRAAAAREEA